MEELEKLLEELGNLSTTDVFFAPLVVAVAIYWIYCVVIAFSQSTLLNPKVNARAYFIAGRSLNIWIFIFAATATSFSGWTFMSHPGVIYEYGFPAAFASFYAITIPLSGVFFLKRQWMLGQRCGFVTPGEMFYAYFKSDAMRYLVLIVALLFSILYIAVQLQASGYLFEILTDKKLSAKSGTILLSMVLLLYVTIGGLRTVAHIDVLQLILKAAGIIALGWIVLHYIGWGDFSKGMERLANFNDYFLQGNTKHFSVPAWDTFANKDAALKEAEAGNYWNPLMIFTFLFALMGIQASPAFSIWAFSTKDPNAFGYQQVWASSLIMGFILIVFTAIIGIGGHFLGADYSLRENAGFIANNNILGIFINNTDLLKHEYKADGLVPLLIRMTLDISPWLMGILAITALAAIQSTAASYMSTIGSMLSRDLLKNGWCTDKVSTKPQKTILVGFTLLMAIISGAIAGIAGVEVILAVIILVLIYRVMKYFRVSPTFGDNWQKWTAALFTLLVTLIAIKVAITPTDTLAFMGALAVAYGVQMMPALIALCWQPFFTAWGIIIGLCVGLVVVTLTELTKEVFPLAIGQWPLTIHSAAWGFTANLALAFFISLVQTRLKQDTGKSHREQFHRFLNDPFLQKVNVPQLDKKHNGWLILRVVIIWAVGAFGFSQLGNSLFGQATDSETWLFHIPSLWVWQIFWWVVGVGMMYWLAVTKRLSTLAEDERNKTIQPLPSDVSDVSEPNDLFCQNIYSKGEKQNV